MPYGIVKSEIDKIKAYENTFREVFFCCAENEMFIDAIRIIFARYKFIIFSNICQN